MTLPNGWVQAPIGSLCTLINGRAFKPSEWSTSGLQIIRIQNLNRKGADFNHFNGAVEEKHLVKAGDLLFAWSGTPGTSFGAHIWQGQQAVLNQHIFKVEYNAELFNKEFFRLAINIKLDELISKAHGGAGLAHVTKGRFEETKVQIPPLAEQGRIIAKLDYFNTRVACALAELNRVRVLSAKLRMLTLASAYNGKFARVKMIKYYPFGNWIGSTFYGPRFSKEDYVEDGVPTIRTTDFYSNGAVDLSSTPRVTCSGADFEKWKLQDGDLLVTRTGSIGKCAIYSACHGPALPSAYLIRVRLKKTVLPRFAWMMLASPQGQAHLGVSSRAVTQPNINAAAIRSLPFPSLTIEQQIITVQTVERDFARADRLEAEAIRTIYLLNRLKAAFLCKVFRGELVPQDSMDEPASVLLDRIRSERGSSPKSRRGRSSAMPIAAQ